MIQNNVDGGCGHFTMTIRPKIVVVGEECDNAERNRRGNLIKSPLKMLMMPVCF